MFERIIKEDNIKSGGVGSLCPFKSWWLASICAAPVLSPVSYFSQSRIVLVSPYRWTQCWIWFSPLSLYPGLNVILPRQRWSQSSSFFKFLGPPLYRLTFVIHTIFTSLLSLQAFSDLLLSYFSFSPLYFTYLPLISHLISNPPPFNQANQSPKLNPRSTLCTLLLPSLAHLIYCLPLSAGLSLPAAHK